MDVILMVAQKSKTSALCRKQMKSVVTIFATLTPGDGTIGEKSF